MPQAFKTSKLGLSLARWIQQLKTEDLDQLNEAVQHLTAHSEAALPLLLEALQGAEEEIRKNVAWILGFIRSPNALGVLFQVMGTDGSMDVRLGASWALRQYDAADLIKLVFQKLPPPRTGDDIREYLESKSWKARWFCVVYLGQKYSPDFQSALMKRAQEDEEILICCAAILSLAAYAAPEVTQLLIRLLGHIDDHVKMEAAAMISIKNDSVAIPELAKQLNAYNSNVRVAAVSAIGALATTPQEVIPHLAQALKDEDAFVRVNAAMAMFDVAQRHRSPHQNLKDLCLKALKDPNVYVVKNAARTLGLVGDEEALREITALLKQEQRSEITANLVHALGLFEDSRSFKILAKAFKHKAWEVRFEAINALSRLKDKRAYSVFLQGLKDPSVMVQEQSVRALGALGNKKAIPALEKLKMQHPYGSINRFINQALDKLLSF